jgi:hypothetical protein
MWNRFLPTDGQTGGRTDNSGCPDPRLSKYFFFYFLGNLLFELLGILSEVRRGMNIYVYKYVCMYVIIYEYACTHTYIYIYINIYAYICIDIYFYDDMYLYKLYLIIFLLMLDSPYYFLLYRIIIVYTFLFYTYF